MNSHEESSNSKKNTLFPFLIAGIILTSAFLGGIFVGYQNRPEIEKVITLTNKEDLSVIDIETTDFSPFWRAWNLINEKYVPANGTSTTIKDQAKVWGAIEGLVGSLDDPYSVFLPPVEATTFQENISGNFGGVGMEVGMRDNILTAIAPLKNTPAEHAGILPGDQILKIDDTSTLDLTIDEAVTRIRGEVGTPVVLLVLHEDTDTPEEIKIIRAIITIPTIDTELREDNVFVISLYNFSAISASLFRDALREFVTSGSNKLVLDLRGNPGGFLEASIEMASWFLPSGKVIVTEDYGGKKENIIHRSKGYDIFNDNLKMIILVNRGSASASEILAGALSEHSIATLVGEKTFGKGSVQELAKVTSDTSLKITVAHWKTPNGTSISKDGLLPEFEVEITEENRDAEEDPQLEKAVELLSQ